MSQTIVCPSCKTQIDLEKISQDKYRLELEADFEKEREQMRKKAQLFAEQKMQQQARKDAVEMQDLKNRIEEASKKEAEFQKQELDMRKRQRELEEKSKNQDLEMAKKLDKAEVEIKKNLEEQMSKTQEEAIKSQVEEQRKKDEQYRKKLEEDFRKKELESFKQQEQMKKTIDDLKRKAEQGSMQIQWDIQEDDLKDTLSSSFPIDTIEDVPTWIKWADLIQTVKNNLWQSSGILVWESKNTKSWTQSWIMKLKEDKLKVNGNIAILITTVLPKEIENFGMLDDVMVCSPNFAIPVATILRERILAVSKTEKSLEWKDAKMEMLYKYLSSEEFSSKMNMMVDVFSNLKSWIDMERRAMERNWKRREKDIERATFAISWMYGELESLMWQELPWSEKMSLESWEEDDEI